MNCREVQGYLRVLLDGEFDEEARVEILVHLQHCGRCRNLLAFEQALRDKVRSSIPTDQTAPKALQLRVQDALSRVEQPAKRRLMARAARWLVPAAAAVLLVVAGLATGRHHVTRGDESSETNRARRATVLAESTIEWHKRDLPLDVTASSPDKVRGFFADKVPFAVRPPHFKQPQVQLVGGRLANLREHAAAYLVYRVRGRRLSVLVFDSTALPKPVRAPQEPLRWHNLRGYNVAVYSSGPTGYAMASDMETDQLVHLLAD